MMKRGFLLLSLGTVMVACGSSDGEGSSNDGGSSSDGNEPAISSPERSTSGKESADPKECNTVTQESEVNVLTNVASEAPTGAGGTLLDGTYVLTAYRKYTGTNGTEGTTLDSLRETLVITGSVVHSLQESSGGSLFRASFAQTTAGASFAHRETCPGTLQGGKGSYTADGDKVLFFSVLFDETTEREFTRR